MTARRALGTLLLLASVVLGGSSPARAQGRRGNARKAAPARRVHAPAPRRVDPPRAPEASARAAAPDPAAGADTLAQADSAAAPAAPHATKPRVYTFGGLDVEGKLKAPQLLYFRSRMRQELDTSSAERRSFLKELEKSADEKGL